MMQIKTGWVSGLEVTTKIVKMVKLKSVCPYETILKDRKPNLNVYFYAQLLLQFHRYCPRNAAYVMRSCEIVLPAFPALIHFHLRKRVQFKCKSGSAQRK